MGINLHEMNIKVNWFTWNKHTLAKWIHLHEINNVNWFTWNKHTLAKWFTWNKHKMHEIKWNKQCTCKLIYMK